VELNDTVSDNKDFTFDILENMLFILLEKAARVAR